VFSTKLSIPVHHSSYSTTNNRFELVRQVKPTPVISLGGTRNEITPDFQQVASRILNSLRKQFGLRVLQIRQDLGKSQEDFAEMVGMSVDFLSLIERGRNSPSFEKLESMAKALSVPVAFLFTFDSKSRLPRPRKRGARRRQVH